MKGVKRMDDETKKILVAMDGSKNAERALIEAKEQGEHSEASITILSVIKPVFLPYYGKSEISKQDREEIEKSREELLKRSLELFEDYPGALETKIRKGDPAEEILEESEDGNYDLIVMGSKGLGLFTRSLLGSVSNKVLTHTKTNVLIVK